MEWMIERVLMGIQFFCGVTGHDRRNERMCVKCMKKFKEGI